MLAGFRVARHRRHIAQLLLGHKALWLVLTTVLALFGGIKSDHASRALMTAVQSGSSVIMVYDTDPKSHAQKHACCSTSLGKLIFIKQKARALNEGVFAIAAVAISSFFCVFLRFHRHESAPPRLPVSLGSHDLLSTVRLHI